MKVLIVGGGIAGLTLARVLAAAEVDFDIVERSETGDPERQGFIIGLWSSGRAVLRRIGLSEEFDAHATVLHEAVFANGAGKILKRVSYRRLENTDGAGLASIKRRDLYALLSKDIAKFIRFGVMPKAITQRGDVVTVLFSDESTGTYDVVVGADGFKSFVREHCFQNHMESFTDWRVWCTWIPQAFEFKNTLTAYVEPRELGVVVHTKDAAMVWLVTPTDHTLWDTESDRIERLTKHFSDLKTLVPHALHHAVNNQIPVSDFMEVKMKHLVEGRIVLVGDAGHCLGPYTGFSSSIAMEDAYILGQELVKAHQKSLGIDSVLTTYEKKRIPRIERLRLVNTITRRLVLSRSAFERMLYNVCIILLPGWLIAAAAGYVTRENIH